MDVIFHIGAHCTDEDRLLKCLLQNRDTLSKEGVVVPGPSRYRPLLREILVSLKGRPATAEMQQMLLDAATDGASAKRLILAHDSFLCIAARALGQHMLYPLAGEKVHRLSQLFPDDRCEFFLGLRNPATFIPALFAKSNEEDFEGFISGVDPRALRWSDTVLRIRNAVPEARLTVWCNEDTPLIWPELVTRIAGLRPGTPLKGTDDLLAAIMQPNGLKRLHQYLETKPPADPAQRRRIVTAYLEKYAIPEALEEEIDLPGWTTRLIDELTEGYDVDVEEIERLEGVNFIAP